MFGPESLLLDQSTEEIFGPLAYGKRYGDGSFVIMARRNQKDRVTQWSVNIGSYLISLPGLDSKLMVITSLKVAGACGQVVAPSSAKDSSKVLIVRAF